MALPDSGMSIVLAVDAGVFRRRAEGPLKTTPAVGCIDNFELDGVTISEIRMRPDIAQFKANGSRVLFSFGVMLRATLAFVPMEAEGDLLVAVSARPVSSENRSLELELAYEQFVLEEGILTQDWATLLDATVRAVVEPLLEEMIAPIPLGDILPDGASLVSPVLLKTIPQFGDFGSTLLIGLEVDTDSGVNQNRFRDEFTSDLLTGGTADWRMEIDSELVRQRADAVLANLDLTENAPNGIENWATTDSTAVLWSGDPITIDTHGQSGYIEEHYDEHPLWFVVEGLYRTDLSVALDGHAVGHADLIIDADAGEILVDPHIFHAGWLFFSINIDDQPGPVPIMNAEVGGGLVIEELGFDSNRLTISGIDGHPGMPGDPRLRAPREIQVNFKPGERGRLCNFTLPEGEIRPDGTVVARARLTNTGDAPLWICQIDTEGDTTFRVRGEAANPAADTHLQLPTRVDAGNSLPFLVLMQVPDGDYEEHQTVLTVRSNDFDRPRVGIPVRGRMYPSSQEVPVEHSFFDERHMDLLCFGIPLLPPQEWFDGILGIVRDITDLIDDRLPPDAVIDLTMSGLPPDGGIVVRDRSGQAVGLTSAVGGLHQLTVPLAQPDQLRFEQVGGRERRLDEARLALGQLETILTYEGSGKPTAALELGGLLFAAFEDGMHIVPLARGKASGIVPLPAPTAISAASGWLFARSEKGVELIDVSDPDTPRHVKTLPLTNEDTFRALPRHLLIMEPGRLRVYGLAPGAFPVWQGEVSTPGMLSLVTPWQKGAAILGESGGLISASLGIRDLTKAKHIKREALPPMLRLLWETRVDELTSLPSFWQRSLLPRVDQETVRVLERRSGKVRFNNDKVVAFLTRRGVGC